MLFQPDSSAWIVDSARLTPTERDTFSSLDKLLATPREKVTSDSRSSVSRLPLGQTYYVKEFFGRRSRLKNLLSIDRYSREVRNLEYFKKLGLRTPDIVAVGHQKRYGLLTGAVLVTREVESATDLYQWVESGRLAQQGTACTRDTLSQLAEATRRMHRDNFYHGDLKPRNVLMRVKEGKPELFFFDCPSGRRIPPPLFPHYRVKELAHIERDLRGKLRKSDLLFLFKQYLGCDRLTAEHKTLARSVLNYYVNRRMNRERRSRLQHQQDSTTSE